MSEAPNDRTAPPATPRGGLPTDTAAGQGPEPSPPETVPPAGQQPRPPTDGNSTNVPDGYRRDSSPPVSPSPLAAETNRPATTASADHDPAAQPADSVASSPGAQYQESQAAGGEQSLVKEAAAFHHRWQSVQVSFVDDPRQAVSNAETLVGDVLNDLTAGFRQQRQELESIWNQGQEASTEHLRRALQRYRDFFERLLRV